MTLHHPATAGTPTTPVLLPTLPAPRLAPGGGDLHRRLAALSLTDKVRLLTGATAWRLHAVTAAGLRPMVLSDGPAGVRGTGDGGTRNAASAA